MSLSLTDDFLAFEAPLLARLKACVPPQVYVLSSTDLAAIKEASQPTPAVHAVFLGYRPAPEAQPGYAHLNQVWLTVVAVRNAAHVASGEGARFEAGPLLGAIFKTLAAWVPDFEGAKCLTLETGPSVSYQGAFAYYPLAWRVAIKHRIRDFQGRNV